MRREEEGIVGGIRLEGGEREQSEKVLGYEESGEGGEKRRYEKGKKRILQLRFWFQEVHSKTPKTAFLVYFRARCSDVC